MLLCKFWKIQKSSASYLFSRMFARHCGARWRAFVAPSWTLLQMGLSVVRRRWGVSGVPGWGRKVGIGALCSWAELGRRPWRGAVSGWMRIIIQSDLPEERTPLPLFLLSLHLGQVIRETELRPKPHSNYTTSGPPFPDELLWSLWSVTSAELIIDLHFNLFSHSILNIEGFPGGSDGKESACNVGDLGLIPGSGRSPEEGNGSPLQYSCLGNTVNRGAWWATVHGVAKLRIQLSDWNFHFHIEHWEGQVSGFFFPRMWFQTIWYLLAHHLHVCVFSCFSCVWLFVTPWTVALQAPLSMGFSRQAYWSELLCPPPGDLPNPGIEPASPAVAGEFFTHWASWEACSSSDMTAFLKVLPIPKNSERLDVQTTWRQSNTCCSRAQFGFVWA